MLMFDTERGKDVCLPLMLVATLCKKLKMLMGRFVLLCSARSHSHNTLSIYGTWCVADLAVRQTPWKMQRERLLHAEFKAP